MDQHNFETIAESINTCCVKCRKPQSFDFNQKISRCPFCMDFFKPKAQLIFLLEEELETLLIKKSKLFFFKFPLLSWILLIASVSGSVFATDWIQLLSIIFLIMICISYGLNSKNPMNHRIRELETSIKTLENSYQLGI